MTVRTLSTDDIRAKMWTVGGVPKQVSEGRAFQKERTVRVWVWHVSGGQIGWCRRNKAGRPARRWEW